jgi:hypothetical protein
LIPVDAAIRASPYVYRKASGMHVCALTVVVMDFVERWLAWSPDGGDGSFEFVFLFGGAIGIVLFVLRDRLRGQK